jgi:hypothetical protein
MRSDAQQTEQPVIKMNWIKSILPTIGNLLGGPLGGAAVEAVGKALGMSEATADKVQKALSSGNLSADQMAALQSADIELKTRMAELGIDAERIAQADRESARSMQTQTGSWVPASLAVVLTICYLTIICCLLTGDMKLWENPTLTLLLGGLTTGFTSVLSFYFGASHTYPTDKK